MNVNISKTVGDRIAKLEDDVVALVALDLNQSGLLDAAGFAKWRGYMTTANLYDSHWLLAYEAHEQGWLPSRNGNDYVAADSFFSILRHHGVRFYGGGRTPASGFFMYSKDEDEEDVPEIGVGELPPDLLLPPPATS